MSNVMLMAPLWLILHAMGIAVIFFVASVILGASERSFERGPAIKFVSSWRSLVSPFPKGAVAIISQPPTAMRAVRPSEIIL